MANERVNDEVVPAGESSWAGMPRTHRFADGLPRPDSTIGPYRLLEVLGEGGFGVVWLAEQVQPVRRRVAVKVIKPGMDSTAVIARFEQERQVLALLNHPNVAQVFDAGTTPGGRPFFAMEHVPGEPITTYADRHLLSLRQRLELFIPVCEAIHHAHQKGIIHRDIKPSNLLVMSRDGNHVPRIIDFGVAKSLGRSLSEGSSFTAAGQIVGTPEYMSPEQAEMGAIDIDTRADVYSLGVVLYELLAGLLPFEPVSLRAAGYDAMFKALRDQDPPRPSSRISTVDPRLGESIASRRVVQRDQLAKELRRELEWIPLKALRKDRSQRYESAAALAKDIQRYLDGSALDAGPESSRYKLRKFVRRNRLPVAGGLALAGTLVLGMTSSLVLWRAAHAASVENERLAGAASLAAQAAERSAEEAYRERTKAERNGYVASIKIAEIALESGRTDLARAHLDECPSGLRGWEWGWVDARCDASALVLRSQSGGIREAGFSPDGGRLATLSTGGAGEVWDFGTGESITRSVVGTGFVASSALSRDGFRVAAASDEGTVVTLDLSTGERQSWAPSTAGQGERAVAFSDDLGRVLSLVPDGPAIVRDARSGTIIARFGGRIDSAAPALLSPDGSTALYGCIDGSAEIWDVDTRTRRFVLADEDGSWACAAFSPTGDRLVTGTARGHVRVSDASTGVRLHELTGLARGAAYLCFGPDGERILASSRDGRVVLWDAASGATLHEFVGHTRRVNTCRFNRAGDRVVTASADRTVRAWDAVGGGQLGEFVGHTEEVLDARFSADGQRIVSLARDGTARVWMVPARESFTRLGPHLGSCWRASMSPDQSSVVVLSKGMPARVWDVASGRLLKELSGHAGTYSAAVFSPTGTRLATASSDGCLCIWDTTSWERVLECRTSAAAVDSLSFSTDGKVLAVASALELDASIWSAESGSPLVTLRGHAAGVTSIAISPDGKYVVTGSADATAKLWSRDDGRLLRELRGHEGAVEGIMYSADGTRVLTRSRDESCRVWDTRDGRSLAVIRSPSGHLLSAAFDPAAKRVVTTFDSSIVLLWDLSAKSQALGAPAPSGNLMGHTRGVCCAAFNSDGSRLVTGSWDHTARVWDTATLKCVAELTGHADTVEFVAFSPDGTLILTASSDYTSRLWDSVPWRSRLRQARSPKR